jgi:hypothetical protein
MPPEASTAVKVYPDHSTQFHFREGQLFQIADDVMTGRLTHSKHCPQILQNIS